MPYLAARLPSDWQVKVPVIHARVEREALLATSVYQDQIRCGSVGAKESNRAVVILPVRAGGRDDLPRNCVSDETKRECACRRREQSAGAEPVQHVRSGHRHQNAKAGECEKA